MEEEKENLFSFLYKYILYSMYVEVHTTPKLTHFIVYREQQQHKIKYQTKFNPYK